MTDMPLFSHAPQDKPETDAQQPSTLVRVEAIVPVDILNACEGLVDYTDLWWPRNQRLSTDPEAQLIWDENSLFEIDEQGNVHLWGHNHRSEPPLKISILLENEAFPHHIATFTFTPHGVQSTRVDIRAEAPRANHRITSSIWRDVLQSYSTFMGNRERAQRT